MQIRNVANDDINKNLDNIFIEGYRYHQNGRPDIFDNKSNNLLRDELINIINNKNINFLVAEDNNIIIGYVICYKKITNAEILFVDQLLVSKNYQKSGVGKLLMKAAESYGKNNKCKKIEFECWAFNKNALGFYNHLGYEQKIIKFEKNL